MTEARALFDRESSVEHDLLAVVRWVDRASLPGFVRLLMDSVAGD